jgi:hypothetical protein
MDTRRHVSITQPTSVACSAVMWDRRAIVTAPGRLSWGKSEEHAAMQRKKD